MSLAGILVLLLSAGTAWPVVRAIASLGPDRLTRIGLEASLATGLGLGLSSCAFFVASLASSPSRAAAVASDLVLVGLAIGVLAVVGRARAGRAALLYCLVVKAPGEVAGAGASGYR